MNSSTNMTAEKGEQTGLVATAESLRGAMTYDPGLRRLAIKDAGEAVRLAGLMAKSAEAVPPHLREKPGTCLCIVMRANHWGVDPFALAPHSYVAKSGGVLGYESQVFGTVLDIAGINLRPEWRGSLQIKAEAAKGSKGGQTAPQTAVGDRTCTVTGDVSPGETRTYTTPALNEIHPKNSPLWQTDPDRQLFYFAQRAWCRMYKPGLFLGAYSRDELDDAAPMMAADRRAATVGGEDILASLPAADAKGDGPARHLPEAEEAETVEAEPEAEAEEVQPSEEEMAAGLEAAKAAAAAQLAEAGETQGDLLGGDDGKT